MKILKRYGETVSLSTTAKHILFRPGYNVARLYCASDFRVGLAPKLAKVVFFNATATTYTDYTSYAVDRNDSTHVPLDGMISTDILYLGFKKPVRGFYLNIGGNVNAQAATLDMEYMSAITSAGVGTFTDVAADSDGTTSGGATLAVDGLYSFTLPAVTNGRILNNGDGTLSQDLYWYRFKPSTTLSVTVDIVDIIPACDTTNYGYALADKPEIIRLNTAKNGAFEFSHSDNGTLYIDWLEVE